MEVKLRDWLYIVRPGKKRGYYGFVFTIDNDNHIHVWDPRRYMGHRIATEKDSITVVCRNVRLKRPGPDYLSMYSSGDLPWREWQTLGVNQ